MYFMVKSCIHTVWPPELQQNMPYFSPVSPASTSTEFCKAVKTQPSNSVEMGKFGGSVENSAFRGKLLSVCVSVLLTLLIYYGNNRPFS